MATIKRLYSQNQFLDRFLVDIPNCPGTVGQIRYVGDNRPRWPFECRYYQFCLMPDGYYFYSVNPAVLGLTNGFSFRVFPHQWLQSFNVFDSRGRPVYLVGAGGEGEVTGFEYEKATVCRPRGVDRTNIPKEHWRVFSFCSDNLYVNFHHGREAFEIKFRNDSSLIYRMRSINNAHRIFDWGTKSWFVDICEYHKVMDCIESCKK